MGFYKANNNINPIVFKASCLLQHLPGFPHTSAVADINLEFTPLRPLDETQKTVGSVVAIHRSLFP